MFIVECGNEPTSESRSPGEMEVKNDAAMIFPQSWFVLEVLCKEQSAGRMIRTNLDTGPLG